MAEFNKAASLLSTLLPGKVSLPGTAPYTLSQSTYFTAQAASHIPSCVITPTGTADVSLAIHTLATHLPDTKFAIRGGGHTLNGGAANITKGVVLNLRAMNTVTFNADQSIVSIGGGATWGEVYRVLDALGLATSGGRVSSVGVGGLCLGGGISYFSARKGLVCDNIVSYEVVLPDGEVVIASRDTPYGDLWRALKGGAGNFGVVTRFDIRTFRQGPFFGGVVISPIETLEGQLRGLVDLLVHPEPDMFASLILSMSWNQTRNGFSVFCIAQYTEENSDPECLRPFTCVEPQLLNTMRTSTLSVNFSDYDRETRAVKAGLRNQFATTTFAANLPILQEVVALWKSSVTSISHISSINWAISVQPFPTSYSTASSPVGSINVLGLNPAADGSLILLLLSYNWVNEADDEEVEAAAQKLIRDIDAKSREMGGWNRFKYLNYAAYWQEQDVFAGYGKENVAYLRKVQQKYDPRGIWRDRCPGGFKIPK